MRISFVNITCAGDEELGIPYFKKRLSLNLPIEKDELEWFRRDLSLAFRNILGGEVDIVFSNEINTGEVHFDPIKPEANEPGIGS